jgi:hypothetical protein
MMERSSRTVFSEPQGLNVHKLIELTNHARLGQLRSASVGTAASPPLLLDRSSMHMGTLNNAAAYPETVLLKTVVTRTTLTPW